MRSICTAALVLTAALHSAAVAAPTKPPVAVDPAVAPFVKSLHQVVQLLNEANHDYDGHRAKAVHEVHKAIHALHPHHKHPQPGTVTTAKPPVKEPKPMEDQKVSDAQLTQAMQALQMLQTQLGTSTVASHQKAAIDIAAAIAELKIALSIK